MLIIVKLVASLAPSNHRLAGDQLPTEVVDCISLFLLEVYCVWPEEAVEKNWPTLLQYQLTSDNFGRRFDDREVAQAVAKAAKCNRLEMIKMLLAYRPRLDIRETLGDMFYSNLAPLEFDFVKCPKHPFTMAAAQNQLEILKWFWQEQRHRCTPEAIESAASEGHLTVVQWLCDHKLTLNAQDAAGRAASKGHWDVVEFLIRRGVVNCIACVMDRALGTGDASRLTWLDAFNDDASGRMHLCTKTHTLTRQGIDEAAGNGNGRILVKGSVPMLEWLVDRFQSLEFRPGFLKHAASGGDLPLVEWLYERVKPVEARSKTSLEALEVACRNGHVKVVKFLVAHGYVPSSLDNAVFCYGKKSHHVKVVKYLKEQFGDSLTYSADALNTAACGGHLEMVKLLDPTFRCPAYMPSSFSAAYFAAREGHEEMLNFLLANDPTSDCYYDAFVGAIAGEKWDQMESLYHEIKQREWWGQGKFTVQKVMLETHADSRVLSFLLREESNELQKGDWSFVAGQAMLRRDLQSAKLLHRKKAHGGFALESAVQTGSLDLVRMVYEQPGATCNASWALPVTAALGYLHIVKFFLEIGEETNLRWAFRRAARNGHLNLVKFLHLHRHDICSAEAVAKAAKHGHLEVVLFLVTHCSEANPEMALLRAQANDHLEIVRWIQAYQAHHMVGLRA